MRVKKKKDQKVYSYSGDLEQEIKKAKSEYMEKETSQERVFLLWQYQRAKKAYEKYEQRITDLKGFIELAEAELKKTGEWRQCLNTAITTWIVCRE